MQIDELVLSDVHLHVSSSQSQNYYVSRLYFSVNGISTKDKETEGGTFRQSLEIKGETNRQSNVKEGKKCEVEGETNSLLNARKRKKPTNSQSKERNSSTEESHTEISNKQNDIKTEKRGDLLETSVDCTDQLDLTDLEKLKSKQCNLNTTKNCSNEQDDDGDYKVKRKRGKFEDLSFVNIVHQKETTLEKVGQQIWLASLFLSDYLVSQRDVFSGTRILELGAGVGLTSVVAAMYAGHVMCTDFRQDILELAKYNLDSNTDTNNYDVMKLDWFSNQYCVEETHQKDEGLSSSLCGATADPTENTSPDMIKCNIKSCDNKTCKSHDSETCKSCDRLTCKSCGDETCKSCASETCKSCDRLTCKSCDDETCKSCDSETCKSCDRLTCKSCDDETCKSCDSETCKSCDDEAHRSHDNVTTKLQDALRTEFAVESCDIILSADVIYDDDATDALFRTVYWIMTRFKAHTWFIAIEKRYVFTWNDLDVACPAYQHFKENLTQLVDMDEGFTVTRVGDFPQCFQYRRTKELELWKVNRTCVGK